MKPYDGFAAAFLVLCAVLGLVGGIFLMATIG